MKFFVVVQAAAYSISADEFAVDSAFARHLCLLREKLGTTVSEVVMVGPGLSRAEYEAAQSSFERVRFSQTGVRFLPAYPAAVSRPGFLLCHLVPVWKLLRKAFSTECVVQSGMSTALARPLMWMACLAGHREGRKVVFMVDTDFRRHSERFHQLGVWGLRSYLVNRYVYDPLKWVQLWLAPRWFDLCLFKSRSLVRAFDAGRGNVHDFFDTVHGSKDVIGEAPLKQRLAKSLTRPLRIACFGRFVPYKGLGRVIEAVAVARARGTRLDLRFVGDGECLPELKAQVARLGLDDQVKFVGPQPYGPALFAQLDECDLAAAAPLVEDTPRAAFDAMARGLPIVAFDITYFNDLAEASGAVVTTPWPSPEGMADALVRLHGDRQAVARMSHAARTFALENTQELWLDRRMGWLRELAARG